MVITCIDVWCDCIDICNCCKKFRYHCCNLLIIILCFMIPDFLVIMGNISMCIATVDPMQVVEETQVKTPKLWHSHTSWCTDADTVFKWYIEFSSGFTFALCLLEVLLSNIDCALLDCMYGLIRRMVDCNYRGNGQERIVDQLVKFEPSTVGVSKPTKQDIVQFAAARAHRPWSNESSIDIML